MGVPKPTPAELDILQVLWEIGPATVRQVHQILSSQREAGYTTVLKLLQIMAEKGLVRRDESQRAHVYAAAVPKGQTQRQLVTELVNRVFGGSAAQLMQQALAGKKASPGEIAEIRRVLREYEGGGRSKGGEQ
jgi:predicted transcriptional regulator